MGITLKPSRVIARMKRGGEIVAEALSAVRKAVQPGISTAELDAIAEETIRMHKGARPAFKGYRDYPATLCVSVNEEVVHGIPARDRRLREGDIVSLDIGVQLNGYFTDAAITVPVGKIPDEVAKFLAVTEHALMEGINEARPGGRLGDISATIQGIAEGNGYSVVRSLVGHGIGSSLHEDPQVPNFGNPDTGIELVEGLVLAIEPMFNMGGWEVRTLRDNWTVVTVDGSCSAHFEHTVAITRDKPLILTACGLC
ncbi:MAG: type I methionyl aminopeptidase [Candidatus Glassbacteria bacterium RBG_16_58_8]|uniref:Methionine aminopeptidase n=1 Tax=Candidatus Glassbacteria bacterium RBG_16_58_8 TaxID=1817866 RepID=A0A1F5YA02_9BACT|nr:MAG: type I methionyl aminopeptidase [Candidatus Glassbacteria bacterium RBG_16_58_8]